MFTWLENLASMFTFDILDIEKNSHFGEALNFFIYDTIKIFILLVTIIYLVTLLRSYFPIEKVRDYLSGKNKILAKIILAITATIAIFTGALIFCRE